MGEIIRGKIKQPLSILIYGKDKTGKTTFASQAPNPIFIDIERGSGELDVARTEYPDTFNDIIRIVEEVATKPEYKEFETLVIDSLGWAEAMAFKQVVATQEKMYNSIADIPFGKGYPQATILWKELIEALRKARAAGKNILLIAHSVVKKFDDPNAPAPYDRYVLNLHEGSTASKTDSTSDLFRQFVDVILFATHEVYPNADDPRRPYGDGTRILYTEGRPSHDGGNRLGLPYKLPLDWATFYLEASPKKGEAEAKLKAQIEEMIPKVKDEEKRKKIMEALPKKKTLGELSALKTRVEAELAN